MLQTSLIMWNIDDTPTWNIWYITALRYNCDSITIEVSVEMIKIKIDTLQSDSITPKETTIDHFTQQKLKKLSTKNKLNKGEHQQINQCYDRKMFGDSIDSLILPKNCMILGPH